MRLVWHIVKKDLRRLAGPVVAWVVFVAVAMVWWGVMHMSEDVVRAAEPYRWIYGLEGLTLWMTGMVVVTSVLLAGYLVLEDTVTGTTSFWLTRPIARSRMLTAKLIAAGLLLVAAPAAVLVPCWWANGFSLSETARAFFEHAAWQTVIVVLAFALASLSSTLARFFFATCGVAVVYVLAVAIASETWRRPFVEREVMDSRLVLTLGLPVVCMTGVMVFQFLTRRSWAGWCTVALSTPAMLAVGMAWPFDVTSLWRLRAHVLVTEATGADAEDRVVIEKIVVPGDHTMPPKMLVHVGARMTAGQFLAPESGDLELRLGGQRRIGAIFAPSPHWGGQATKQLAGFGNDRGDVEWSLMGRTPISGDWMTDSEATGVAGVMEFVVLSGRVLAELPLLAGAQGRSGSSATRIAGFRGETETTRPCIIVEERDSIFLGDGGLNAGRNLRRNDGSRRDSYLLVNRRLGVVQDLQVFDVGAAGMGSLLVGVRRLDFSNPERVVNGRREEIPHWRDGAMLIKVRFELERRVRRMVKSERVPFVAEEAK